MKKTKSKKKTQTKVKPSAHGAADIAAALHMRQRSFRDKKNPNKEIKSKLVLKVESGSMGLLRLALFTRLTGLKPMQVKGGTSTLVAIFAAAPFNKSQIRGL